MMLMRTAALYLILIGVIRFLGKRQIGQMEPSEVVVTMVVADLAATTMQDVSEPILSSIVPIGTVLVMELLLSTLSLNSVFVRKLLCGKPVILIENGRFIPKNMKKTRITVDELTAQLRQKNVIDPSRVQYAILETGGNLSVFPYPEEQPATAKDAGITPETQYLPFSVVEDGRICHDNLKKAGKDPTWLYRQLQKENISLKEVFYMTVDEDNTVTVYKKK